MAVYSGERVKVHVVYSEERVNVVHVFLSFLFL